MDCKQIAQSVSNDRQFLAPLGAGGHVDHRITRSAAEKLGGDLSITWICLRLDDPDEITALLPAGAQPQKYDLSAQGLRAWRQAIVLYPSQLHSFWISAEEMETQITAFSRSPLGCCFWKA
jgi:hypothetical protein